MKFRSAEKSTDLNTQELRTVMIRSFCVLLINQDKDVPEELIKQIEEYDKKVLQLN